MKRLTVLFVLVLLLAGWQLAGAKEPVAKVGSKEPLKIGIVDMQKILQESKAAKAARDEFVKEVESKRRELATKAQEVQRLEQELAKMDPKTPPEQRREKQDRLKQQARELNNLRQDIDEELKRRDRELTQKLIGEIMGTIRNFAQTERFTLILERSSILAAEESLDITDRIIKLHDGRKK